MINNFDFSKEYKCSPTIICGGFTKLMYIVAYENEINDAKNIIISEVNNNDLNYINQKNDLGWNALMIACRYSNLYNNFDTIQLLLNNGADINSQNNDGWTALMWASHFSVYAKNINAIKLLLDQKVNIDLQNKEGYTALMIACRYSNTNSDVDIVELLLNHGSNVNAQCNNGWTALMISCKYSYTESNIETIKILLSHNANTNFQNDYGWSALMIVSRYSGIDGDISIIKLLLDYGANVNTQCNNGWTALMFVSRYFRNNKFEIAKLFIDNGTNINLQNKNGQTVLLIECRYNNRCDNIEFIKLLLDNGANINHQCNNNETALIIAAKQHYLKIVNFLLDNHADYSIVDNSRKIFINYLYGQQSISCLKIINDIEYTKKCKKYIHQQLFHKVNEFMYRPDNIRHKLINAKFKLFTDAKINNFNFIDIINNLKLFYYFSIHDIESFQIRINELELMHLDK
ncbi:ankyrin repeat protein [Bandra megavirus]|uniref:Ankyrin repeat protein n=1 Tax=Bandra megavirus TaxID=2071566 RepID=A0A2K9V8A5_9VIRU|nr:ankyrin repeat protein [Bandra megavirus]